MRVALGLLFLLSSLLSHGQDPEVRKKVEDLLRSAHNKRFEPQPRAMRRITLPPPKYVSPLQQLGGQGLVALERILKAPVGTYVIEEPHQFNMKAAAPRTLYRLGGA